MMSGYSLPNPADFEHQIEGRETHLILLENASGVQVALSDYGARIVSIWVPDKDGQLTDVVLGFNTIKAYLEADEQYHGVTVGRYANRIANGTFSIDGQTYRIAPNNGPNALHGGAGGFHKRVWDRRINYQQKAAFHYVSQDGEEGFPGTLSVMVEYHLSDDNELIISYHAETDKPTVVNLTNHAYFNLNGEGRGDVRNHVLRVNASSYLPIDDNQIPIGNPEQVAGTPFDFREAKAIGQDIDEDHVQLVNNRGYDHSYVLDEQAANSKIAAATAISPETGIRLDVYTTEPAVQLYTGNWLSGKDIGKAGNPYSKHHAFCLETQHYPDSPNQTSFPSTLLLPGQTFRSETRYRFSVEK